MNVSTRPVRPEEFELVRTWLRDPGLGGFEKDSDRPGEIIEVDGEPVGWIDPHRAYAPAWQDTLGPRVGDEPWTLDLFVVPNHWGRGIGRAAISTVSARCLAADATSMVVDVERDNVASCRAFVGAGWQLVATNDDEFLLTYPPKDDA